MNLALETVALKVLQALVSGNIDGVVVKSNTFNLFELEHPVMDDAFMQRIMSDREFSDQFRESLLSRGKPAEALITVDGVDFHFKKSDRYGLVSIYRLHKGDFSAIDSKFNETVTDDVAVLTERFKELAIGHTSDDFALDTPYDRFVKSGVIGFGMYLPMTYFVSEHFIDLCRKSEALIDQESCDILLALEENPMVAIPEVNDNLNYIFDKWFKFLVKKKATVNKQFIYNDHDNFAYQASNHRCEMMFQRSQNVVYVYVREKSSGTIKVFNSVAISVDYMEDMIKDWISDDLTYVEVMNHIMDSYGAPMYPIGLDHLDGYLKSPEYHMNNFDSDDNIIYDSVRGYNTRSKHVSNMISDFDILKMLMDDGHI